MALRKRRGKGQIIYQILSLCKGNGAGKTKIVYASNLNFANANEYLDLLIKNDLLMSGTRTLPFIKQLKKGLSSWNISRRSKRGSPRYAVRADGQIPSTAAIGSFGLQFYSHSKLTLNEPSMEASTT